jgi:hypothetical protein
MNWPEYCLARLLLAEERVGSRLRAQDWAELERERESQADLQARGLVR